MFVWAIWASVRLFLIKKKKKKKKTNWPLLDLSASPHVKMAVDIVDKPFVLLADYDIDFDHDQP